MSRKTDNSNEEYRKATENGQVTIPAEYRGDEQGYVVRKEGDEIILVPAERTESVRVVTNE